MEARLSRVTEELKQQTELQQSTLQRAQSAEQQVQDLKGRTSSLEAELLMADKQRDSLQRHKQHVGLDAEVSVKSKSIRLKYRSFLTARGVPGAAVRHFEG